MNESIEDDNKRSQDFNKLLFDQLFVPSHSYCYDVADNADNASPLPDISNRVDLVPATVLTVGTHLH
jgi:hypothetical protein